MCLNWSCCIFWRRFFDVEGTLNIYAGDPKTNPTKMKIVRNAIGGPFVIIKACGLKFKQGASMATSSFIDFNADMPAKVLFYTNTKVSENTLWTIKFSHLNSGTDVHQHDR
jgi:hypothetical protein